MKFTSIRRKKRKGFHGVRPQELPNVIAAVDSNVFVEPVTAEAGPSNDERYSMEEEISTEVEADGEDTNFDKSLQKLANSSFSQIEDSFGTITRSKSIDLLGRGSGQEHEAKGFKNLDRGLLASTFSDAFLCNSDTTTC